jgi:hypothetical protein
MTIESLESGLEIASYLVVILSVPIALWKYLQSKRREQEQREFEAYHVANEKYFHYLDLCFSNPDLDIFKYSDELLEKEGLLEQKRELIAFCNITSMFERAHFMYADTGDLHKDIQWYGWDGMIGFYCQKDNFRRAWKVIGRDWDKDFLKYMDRKIAESEEASFDDL